MASFLSRQLRRLVPLTWLLAPLAVLGYGPTATAEPANAPAAVSGEQEEQSKQDPGEKWVRLRTDKKQKPQAMETAIVRYVKADDVEPGKAPSEYKQYVDLVGAVHVGDRAYYDKLNRRFRKYDAVLFELVAPEGTEVPRGRGTSNANPLGALQNGMKSVLELEHQLEHIDYSQDNMIHADLSPEDFFESMEQREETFANMYFRMMGASMAMQSEQAAKGENANIDFMSALFSEDRSRMLKIAMARQFESMEQLLTSIGGPKGSTLITARNERALDVLEEQLDEGVDRIAIFYGAGHLAEMNDQMAERFDMKPISVEWVEAWDLRE
ncbi:MAG TPA: hypothetical protein VF175_13095 [Lacipirellula sp.]